MSDSSICLENPLAGQSFPGGKGLHICVAPDRARLLFQLSKDDLAQASDLLGQTLPERVGGTDGIGSDLEILCLGPGEFQLSLPVSREGALKEKLNSAGIGFAHSLVDISHRQMAIEVTGPGAALCLRSGCPLDLEKRTDNSCTRTLMGRVQVLLVRIAPENYRVEVFLSQAPFVMAWLIRAARQNQAEQQAKDAGL